jgi:hypothetical protein
LILPAAERQGLVFIYFASNRAEQVFPFGLPLMYEFLHLNPPSLIFNFDFAAGFGSSE